MKSVVVTGGSGKAGRATIRELIAHGWSVLNVDLVPPAEPLCHFLKADLCDLGQAIDALGLAAGTVDRRRTTTAHPVAVVHLAGIPAPGLAPDATVFQNNLMSTYNVFSAATRAGLKRVVWASSETVYGLPLTRTPPAFVPVTEDHPLAPETGYALAKVMCEEMAAQMHRWNPKTTFVGLRISNILEPGDHALIPSWQDDWTVRRWNLWSWVDARDVAQACRLALQADVSGARNYTIAAADTVMSATNEALLAKEFPGVPHRGIVSGHGTLLSIERAQRELGYAPRYSWR